MVKMKSEGANMNVEAHIDLFGPDGRVRQRVPQNERLVVARSQELVALRVRRQAPELIRVP